MPKNIFDVITLGSATVDLILKSSKFKVVKNSSFSTGLALCEIYDSKINIEDLTLSTGGGATNTAASLSHFGLNVSCVSFLGDDLFSSVVLEDLKKYKVDTSNLRILPNKKTALSVILSPREGGRTVMIHRGACKDLSINSFEKLPKASWAYITNLGGDFKNVYEVILFLKKMQIKVFWNPGLNEVKNFDVNVLKSVDILSLNLEEALKLSKLKPENNLKNLLIYFKKFKNLITLITLGSRGAFLISPFEVLHISSFKVPVTNSLGAGDAFGSGFLFGFIEFKNIKKALEYGIKNAINIIQIEPTKGNFLKSINDYPSPKIKLINL